MKLLIFLVLSRYGLHGFKCKKSWYTFFRAPNKTFTYTIVHLTFRASQTVARIRVYANAYPAVHLPKRYNMLQQKVNVRSIPLGAINI